MNVRNRQAIAETNRFSDRRSAADHARSIGAARLAERLSSP